MLWLRDGPRVSKLIKSYTEWENLPLVNYSSTELQKSIWIFFLICCQTEQGWGWPTFGGRAMEDREPRPPGWGGLDFMLSGSLVWRRKVGPRGVRPLMSAEIWACWNAHREGAEEKRWNVSGRILLEGGTWAGDRSWAPGTGRGTWDGGPLGEGGTWEQRERESPPSAQLHACRGLSRPFDVLFILL